MSNEIVVIAELSDNRVLPVTYELIAFARALSTGDFAPVRMIVPGRDVHAVARDLADDTGMDVIALVGDPLEFYNAETWMTVLATWLTARKPRYICIPHTSRGCDFAPGLAVRLGASCITAVEGFRRQGDAIRFVHTIFNGKIKMDVATEMDTTVLTMLPGAFKAVEVLKIPDHPQKIRTLGVIPAEEQDLDLALADVIVSAGRGIGAEENLALIRRLAGLFSKSAVGCSRTVCDRGWLGYKHQIGLTGKTVAPKLYIACGISGAVQHVAGMRGSKMVVAVNKDPGAAIFQIADIGIVEDLITFIPLVIN
jgi:electron transfer flavoprotein alpha subunit